jgi:hypothetical protein
MSKQKANVLHVTAGDNHAVAAQLRVLICPAEEGGFVAQGLEIDYCATGATVEQVQQRFAEGLLHTAERLVKRGRSLSALMKTHTPRETWQEYLTAAEQHELACATVFKYEADDVPAGMPFTSLAFCNSQRSIQHA